MKETVKAMERMTFKEFANMNLVAENYQRSIGIGGHPDAHSKALLENAKGGAYLGVAHVAEIGQDEKTGEKIFAVIDGNSRREDYKKWIDGKIKVRCSWVDVKENGESKDVTKAVAFADCPTVDRNAIDNAQIDVVFHDAPDFLTRAAIFTSINSGKSLTGMQKNVGGQSDDFYTLDGLVREYCEAHNIFTDAQLQRDETRSVTALIMANLTGNYNSAGKKVMDAVRSIPNGTIDLDRIAYIMQDVLANDDGGDKYGLITAVCSLYDGDKCLFEDGEAGYKKKAHYTWQLVADTYTQNLLAMNLTTGGANSAKVNEERFDKMKKKARKHLDMVASEAPAQQAQAQPEAATLADVAAMTAAEGV